VFLYGEIIIVFGGFLEETRELFIYVYKLSIDLKELEPTIVIGLSVQGIICKKTQGIQRPLFSPRN
jgi:hypothetical protein